MKLQRFKNPILVLLTDSQKAKCEAEFCLRGMPKIFLVKEYYRKRKRTLLCIQNPSTLNHHAVLLDKETCFINTSLKAKKERE